MIEFLQDSDGLIVPGRDLEHFEVTKVLSGPDFPLYFSQFLDQHCVLRVCCNSSVCV